MEGLTIDTSQSGVAQWRAVCPECGMDNFGPLKPERRVRWVVWAVRGITAVAIIGSLVLSWLVASALRPFFP